jgi:hypothetical protein
MSESIESVRISRFLTFVVVLLIMVLGRVYIGSVVEYNRAVEAAGANDEISAIIHHGRAIKWYAPLNPWVKDSAQALWDIGESAARRGDMETAIFAVETLRSSLHAARGPFQPMTEWIDRSNLWLADHIAQEYPNITEEEVMDTLTRPTGPHRGWSVLVGVGFVGWIMAVFLFIFTAFPIYEEGKSSKKAVFACVAAAVFYLVWILGLYLA